MSLKSHSETPQKVSERLNLSREALGGHSGGTGRSPETFRFLGSTIRRDFNSASNIHTLSLCTLPFLLYIHFVIEGTCDVKFHVCLTKNGK